MQGSKQLKKADVTLRSQFHIVAPDGEYVGVTGKGMLRAGACERGFEIATQRLLDKADY